MLDSVGPSCRGALLLSLVIDDGRSYRSGHGPEDHPIPRGQLLGQSRESKHAKGRVARWYLRSGCRRRRLQERVSETRHKYYEISCHVKRELGERRCIPVLQALDRPSMLADGID